MTSSLTPSQWPIYEVEWVKAVPWERTEGRPWTEDEATWVLTTQEPSSPPTRTYSPLQDFPGLFKTFADTPPTREGIAQFASRYGILGLHPPLQPLWEYRGPPSGDSFWDHRGRLLGESLEEWESQILGVKLVQQGLAALKDADLETLRRVYEGWMALDLEVLPGGDFPKGPEPDSSWIGGDGQLDLVQARSSLGSILTAALKGHLSATIVPSAKGSFDFFLVPDSLISAIWYQVAQSVLGDKDFRRCKGPGCDQWIEISLGPKGSKSSKYHCSTGCRMKALRIRQKEAKEFKRQGKSIPEIAKALGSTSTTVKKWLRKPSRTRPTTSP